MKEWDEKEKRNSFISGFLHYLDFGRFYDKKTSRVTRFFANVIMLSGVMFIGMTVISFLNYGLEWLVWSSQYRTP